MSRLGHVHGKRLGNLADWSVLSRLKQRGQATFIALRHRNYRLWFFGQMLSLMGTFMQSVAQGWLVYDLTGSEFALGTVTFAGSLPTLFLMIPAGALADRLSKRWLLIASQAMMMLLALTLAVLAGIGVVQYWHILLLAAGLGIANSFDAPTRQALVVEMVEDRRDLMNAIALNSALFNVARIVGPSVGGILLAWVGPAWCFGGNGLSFLAVIVALLRMRFPETPPAMRAEPLRAQVGAGLRYIAGHPLVRAIIALAAVSSLFGFSYIILLPVFARDVLRVGQAGLGTLYTAIGLGALAGSLTVATMTRSRRKGLLLIIGSLLFPTAILGFAFSRFFPLSLVCLALAGFGMVAQNASSNTLIQTVVPDHLRGRVMGVYMVMFFGTMPWGSLLIGSLAQGLGATMATAAVGGITLAFSLGMMIGVPALRCLFRPE